MAKAAGLLVKVRGDGKAFRNAATKSFGARAIEIEPILTIPSRPGAAKGLAGEVGATWLKVSGRAIADESPWDRAHALIASGKGFAAAGAPVQAIEPDFEQNWLYHEPREKGAKGFAAGSKAEFCTFDPQKSDGGRALGPDVAWNLKDAYSQLAAARARVGDKQKTIRIAHLDTGYDPAHMTRPANLLKDLARSFVEGDPDPRDALDRAPPDKGFFANRGHGTGTLSILAGNKLDGTAPSWPGFKDYVGGAPLAEVLPIRIANWVVRFSVGSMVQGFGYARVQECHVLSMSMGGLSSEALVDVINLAYEDGLVMVTAGGNNVAWVPSPKSIVFPARYKRVLAACGVMADGRAYAGLGAGTMQGNYGPAEKMDTAIGAYTPNVPWAQIDCGKVVDMDGSGTSAATPQVAAAAALWLAEHWNTVKDYSEGWMRVEAVRHALFASAQKSTSRMGADETREKIGRGVVQAEAALNVQPLSEAELKARKTPPAEASWSWANLLFGGGVSLAARSAFTPAQQRMLALELTQMAQLVPEVDAAMREQDGRRGSSARAMHRRYLEAALEHGTPSNLLRRAIEQSLGRHGTKGPPRKKPATVADQVSGTQPAAHRSVKAEPVPDRQLRVFALDPSVGQRLATIDVNETVLSVPWDDRPITQEPLRPGPVGEYLEVVDIDPASNRVYEPVDLNEKLVLAQDGWAPSEGNPKFHQQMVYAVGMTTIRNFERALGRRSLWAPRMVRGEGRERPEAIEVPRLRLYPHALRAQNAYYSPDKKALLFGYFPASSLEGDATTPGSMVFTCLSSDIIAHEMTHALLDGMHRGFRDVSNLDVPAFHEAFADIVALFQHFNMAELVKAEIATARGSLSAASLLGGLAKQFGEGASLRGPLRNYIDPKMRTLRYDETLEAHDRGSILVFAVYEAFLKVVARRTADLIRLATGGTGILGEGALHPDLVKRLADETCKTARHVLTICIRALDYCPPVDITFGEYLRALITADVDVVPDDPFGYRVAFIEAFRERGILPRDVKTYSQESLAWNTVSDNRPAWLKPLLEGIDLKWNQDLTRSEIFALNNENCFKLWTNLNAVFGSNPGVMAELGLEPNLRRYRSDGTPVKEPPKGPTTFEVHSVRPLRRRSPSGSYRFDVIAIIRQRRPVPIAPKEPNGPWFWFRSGATLIFDSRLNQEEIRYAIVKNSGSASRLERQRETEAGSQGASLRALYFGGSDVEPFAALHGG